MSTKDPGDEGMNNLPADHTLFKQRSLYMSHTLSNAHALIPKLNNHFIDRMEMLRFSVSLHQTRYQDTAVRFLVLLFIVAMPLTNLQRIEHLIL